MFDRVCKTDCIFYNVYRDHGASVPLCARFSSEVSTSVNDLEKRCPCECFITRSVIVELQECGDIYTDYRYLLK